MYFHAGVDTTHGLCYIAMRANLYGTRQTGVNVNVVVQSDAGGSHYETQFSLTDGDRVYCVPTLCPQSFSIPSKVSFHQPGRINYATCDNQRIDHPVYPGQPTCYGSRNACESDSTPNLLFSTTCCEFCYS